MILDVEEVLHVGENTFFSSILPGNAYGVVFEDDLRTGYLYAVNNTPDLIILDALHIYDVHNVTDKDKPSKLQIAWTEDGWIASLLINNYCHAIFDFKNKAGYCRNGFPPANGSWAVSVNRSLTDGLIKEIFTGIG